MKLISTHKDGAIVDIDKSDIHLLTAAIRETSQALQSRAADGTKVDEYSQKTGYQKHSFQYLSDWLFNNRPDPAPLNPAQASAAAYLKSVAPPVVKADEALATKIGDVDGPAVRVALTLDAVKILDAALTATLGYHAADNPPNWELATVTGSEASDFQTLQQQIKDILSAETAAPSS